MKELIANYDTKLLEEVSKMTENNEDLQIILNYLKAKLNSNKLQKIFRALKIINGLLLDSSEDFVKSIMQIKLLINSFRDFISPDLIYEESKYLLI
jgi:polysaccharide deacetylase 2 family uncharacterized protein YibQ